MKRNSTSCGKGGVEGKDKIRKKKKNFLTFECHCDSTVQCIKHIYTKKDSCVALIYLHVISSGDGKPRGL